MEITVIVAIAKGNVIGHSAKNGMLWHLPNDLKFFKEATTGHHVLMGDKTHFSIPEKQTGKS